MTDKVGDEMFIIKAILWVMFLPFKILFKLLFWWIPTGNDSFDTDDEEWMFWKGHGHDW